ncbi:MAG: FadR/GntR family transcriptional regulator [Thermoanaerobacterales bacterium]|nr:FadR/GntR family transcriptional regulator [Thermoanaerobacterales bacterium]
MPEFKPIRRRKTYEEIIEQIKHMIAMGTLNPGDRLISEREMANRLEVGRAAVREAFRALEAMGIIEVRQGEGAFVRKCDLGSLIETIGLVLMTERDMIRELLELRKVLEVASAGLAALRHGQQDLDQMEQALVQMERDIVSGDLGEDADWRFHYAVAVATQNPLLVRLMNTIAGTMRQMLYAARRQFYLTPGTPQRLLREHRALFEEIRQGNMEQARQAMYDHLDKVEKAIIKLNWKSGKRCLLTGG